MKKLLLLIFISINSLALEIYPLVSGKIIFIKTEGSNVKKDEVIVKIDPTETLLKLKHQQILQQTYKQNLKDKELILKQKNELYERMVGSHRNVEIAKLEFNEAKYALEAHNINIEITKNILKNHQIISGINAVVEKTPHYRNATNINNPKILMVLKPN